MKIKFLTIGKTDKKEINHLVKEYENKINRYIDFETIVLNTKKTKYSTTEEQKNAEGMAILTVLQNSDIVVLLDENGKHYTSQAFASFFQEKMNRSIKNLVVVIGGPYGFSQSVYDRCNEQIALSKMTFTHDMVRLFFVEQVYRAFSILKNEPYHH